MCVEGLPIQAGKIAFLKSVFLPFCHWGSAQEKHISVSLQVFRSPAQMWHFLFSRNQCRAALQPEDVSCPTCLDRGSSGTEASPSPGPHVILSPRQLRLKQVLPSESRVSFLCRISSSCRKLPWLSPQTHFSLKMPTVGNIVSFPHSESRHNIVLKNRQRESGLR